MARAAAIFLGWVLSASLVAEAQQANTQVHSIGVLVPNRLKVQTASPVFFETLRSLGYRDGDNLRLLVREAEGDLGRLPKLARELVAARVDLILAFNTPGTQAAIGATRATPIVFTQVGDPVGSGFVASLGRPGGNVTGVSNMVGMLAPKRFEVMRETVPSAKRIAVLFNPADPVTAPQVRELESSQSARTVEVRLFPITDPKNLPGTFTEMVAWKANAAMWLLGQHQLFQKPTIALAAQHKLPVMVGNIGDVASGGLVSYTNDPVEVYRRTAALVARILQGAKPSELPVEQSTKFELAVNTGAAKALGLKIPPAILLRADHIVE